MQQVPREGRRRFFRRPDGDGHERVPSLLAEVVIPGAGRSRAAGWADAAGGAAPASRESCLRSEEHTSELQSLMRISYAVFCLKKKKQCITQQASSDVSGNIEI